MFKKLFCSAAFILIVLVFTGCATSPYDYADNWVICQNSVPVWFTKFDVFYIYPTLVSNQKKPLMDWGDPEVAAKVYGFTRAQTTDLFLDKARVFAPFVHQLEYNRCVKYLGKTIDNYSKTELEPGISDTVLALRYYLKRYHTPGRPYILFGHSQGAVDLYEALKRCTEITKDSGFIAAYLIGLPHVTPEKIRADFASRGIVPAAGPKDTGVIIVWNTQNKTAKNPYFTTPGGYVINPLNWKTDPVPVPANQNMGAVFYDYKKKDLVERRKVTNQFCGAKADPSRGALIVDLPSKSKYDANGFMGEGVFHMNDIWFFAMNLMDNARNRVDQYIYESQWKNAETSLPDTSKLK